MLILLIIFGLLPVLIFIGLTVERWLFNNAAGQRDHEWELYQQTYD